MMYNLLILKQMRNSDMKQGNHLVHAKKLQYGYNRICGDTWSIKIRLKNDLAVKVRKHFMLKDLFISNSKNDCSVIYGIADVVIVNAVQTAIMTAKADRLTKQAAQLINDALHMRNMVY